MRHPRIVLLNGPPASGKTTIGQLVAAAVPMCLHIDVDAVRDLLGQWREDPAAAGFAARRLTVAMAREHLAAGDDVVVTQLFGRLEPIETLEAAATDVGATFHEIVLLPEVEECRRRFIDRGGPRLDEAMTSSSGLATIDELYQRVVKVVDARPTATVVRPVADDVDAMARRVEAIVTL